MKTCYYCPREFRDKYNLLRHIMFKHKPQLDEGMKGQPDELCDGLTMYDHPSSAVYDNQLHYHNQAGTGRMEADDAEESEESAIDEEDTSESDEESEEKENPFESIVSTARDLLQKEIEQDKHAETDEEKINKRFQKIFREVYEKRILWMRALKRNPTHKKILETARKLRDDGLTKYDYEESIGASIAERKRLLNRLVPDYQESEENEED